MPWVLVSWMGWHSIVHCQSIQCSSLLLLPLASFPHCWYSEQSFYFACLAPTWPPLTMIQCCWESFCSAMWRVVGIVATSTNVGMSSLEDEQFFPTYPELPSLTNASCSGHRWCVPVLAPTQTEVKGLHSAGLVGRSVTYQHSCYFNQVDVLLASSPLGWGNQSSPPEGSSPAMCCSWQQRWILPRSAGAGVRSNFQTFFNTSEISGLLWGLAKFRN